MTHKIERGSADTGKKRGKYDGFVPEQCCKRNAKAVQEKTAEKASGAGQTSDREEELRLISEDALNLIAMIQEDDNNLSLFNMLINFLENFGYVEQEEPYYSSVSTCLGNIIQIHCTFFGRFLSNIECPISIQAAAARVLLCCSFPVILEKSALENILSWIMEDSVCDKNVAVRHTYSIGLLTLWLESGYTLKDDLVVRISTKLLNYLRHWDGSQQKIIYSTQCLAELGEYDVILKPLLEENGADVCLALLEHYSERAEVLPDILNMVAVFTSYEMFLAMFVNRGGIQKLLSLPRDFETFFGLSHCLCAIGSVSEVMDSVCAFSSRTIQELVKLGLLLLGCAQDSVQDNASLFFTSALKYKHFIEAFEAVEGLPRALAVLHDIVLVRSGVRTLEVSSDPEQEKDTGFYICTALENYFKSQLLLLVCKVSPVHRSDGKDHQFPSFQARIGPLDISHEAMEVVFQRIQDRILSLALNYAEWPACQSFLKCNGHVTMLEICQAPAAAKDIALIASALVILNMVSLVPCSRNSIVNARLSNNRTGIAIILDNCDWLRHKDPSIIQQALKVLINIVGDYRISGDARAGQLGQGYCQAREAIVKVLLQLLETGVKLPLRALACRALLGLSREDHIAYILAEIQVAKMLSELRSDQRFR